MGKVQKTNAMRILEKAKLEYEVKTYETNDGKIDGISVAAKLNKNEDEIFKTIVTIGVSKEIYVFIIPVNKEIDLKKAAKVASEKRIEMLPVNDLLKTTGYIRGGCSPIGMKKLYKTFIQVDAKKLDSIAFSGGRIGTQIEMKPADLLRIINGIYKDIVKD